MVRTGLQRDIGRGTPGRVARLYQGHRLRMWTTAILGPAATHDARVLGDDTAHSRVRPNATLPTRPKRKRKRHETRVSLGVHSSLAGEGRSSSMKSSKSSAAWKFL